MVTLQDVSCVRLQKAKTNHETYRELWMKCSDNVLTKARQKESFYRFVIVPLIPGKPLIDVSRAARYIRDKLERRGFQVTVEMRPPVAALHISWEHSQEIALKELKKAVAPQPTSPLLPPSNAKQMSLLPPTKDEDDLFAMLARQ